MTPANANASEDADVDSASIKSRSRLAPGTRAALIEAGTLGAWDEDNKPAVQEALQQIIDRLGGTT